MSVFKRTGRNRVKRLPQRAQYDKSVIYRIIDEALICHVGFVENNQPFVIPTIHGRVDDNIVLHGSRVSRLLKHIESGNEVCIAITILDGLVLARSVFHHSMNYRSVVLFGKGRAIEDKKEKLAALESITDHIVAGRWRDARQPNRKELNATTVVMVPIEDASAKVRTGPPNDDLEDYELPIWAGILPIRQQAGAPINDPQVREDMAIPGYVTDYTRPHLSDP